MSWAADCSASEQQQHETHSWDHTNGYGTVMAWDVHEANAPWHELLTWCLGKWIGILDVPNSLYGTFISFSMAIRRRTPTFGAWALAACCLS
jgi:hypothetical protein